MYKLESWTSRVEAEVLAEHRDGRRSRSKSAGRRVSFQDECDATVCNTRSPRKMSHNFCGGTVVYTANISTSGKKCDQGT